MKYRENLDDSGEKLCPGDQVTWAGRPGRVLYVMGSDDNPDD